jgi:2-succinyl-6-hydroxy-2,4-cyclohexadiene-1-carboxylate synthase
VTLGAVLDDLDLLTPERVTLAGYSMGGRLALHFALAHPERIERLVLVGASPGIADAAERDERRRADEGLADWIERSTIEEFAAQWETTRVLSGQPAPVLAAVREDRLRNTPAGLARALRGLGTGALPPLWDRLPELAMPAALLVGERDPKFRVIAERMAARMPGASLNVVAGSGHAVHLEDPVRVAAAL